MATPARDRRSSGEDESPPLVPDNAPIDEPSKPSRRGYIGGTVASVAVAGLAIWVMASWSAGASGDVLLGLAAVGLLLCLPHTIPVWAGLTLLVATATA